jgi:hypothetical protein
MAWLLRNGDVLASVNLTTSAIDRLRATATLEQTDAVLLCEGSRIAHSLGSRCSLDVAYLDPSRVVLAVNALQPWRIGRPRIGASAIVEGRAGALTHWNLQPGDCLEIRE